MAKETWKFVQAKNKLAMKQVLGIRDEKARMMVTPPRAVAPITQEDDMRWNPVRGVARLPVGSTFPCRLERSCVACLSECSCYPMLVSPSVRSVLVSARAREPAPKRSL